MVNTAVSDLGPPETARCGFPASLSSAQLCFRTWRGRLEGASGRQSRCRAGTQMPIVGHRRGARGALLCPCAPHPDHARPLRSAGGSGASSSSTLDAPRRSTSRACPTARERSAPARTHCWPPPATPHNEPFREDCQEVLWESGVFRSLGGDSPSSAGCSLGSAFFPIEDPER